MRALDLRPLLSSVSSGSEVATSGPNAADGLSARALELPVRTALAFDSAAVVALAFDDRATTVCRLLLSLHKATMHNFRIIEHVFIMLLKHIL